MSDVISFRPRGHEERIIQRTMESKGFKTRSEAVRYLIAHGPPKESRRDPLMDLRLPDEFCLPAGRSLTSEEIDEALYGDGP